ncbi:MarR family winged helix-turn-helix transcriptional regulator [Mycobacterium sp. AT1]|uniref:MarR family winged helix-turn-helix transcriptional regulator n=1 Tax=Mycobacterium sp. AT1 TaxID=1961706 RepID=UPI0009AD0BD5|nr:MarR family transcriptional regulator [Mycobacterium sp. AT1]OPX05901.1 hypothetical protein B1790_29995 [Mycobacterium sp. AT1]
MTQSEGLLLLLARFEHELAAAIRPTLDSVGISLEHFRLIQTLSLTEYMAMSALAEQSAVTVSSSTRHIDHLVGLGLVLRQPDPFDRRKVVVALTRRGRAIAEKCATAERRIQTTVVESSGSAAQLAHLTAGLAQTAPRDRQR